MTPNPQSASRRAALILAGTALALTLGACTTTPPATRYLLAPVQIVPAKAESELAVRLADVRLPSYFGEAAIPSLNPDGSVHASSGEEWAEDPQQAITRALGQELRAASGATVIYEPWPAGLDSTSAMTVSVHHFLGMPGGEVRLSGQSLLVSSEQVLTVRDFDLRTPVGGVSTPALIHAYAAALHSLAGELAQALKAAR